MAVIGIRNLSLPTRRADFRHLASVTIFHRDFIPSLVNYLPIFLIFCRNLLLHFTSANKKAPNAIINVMIMIKGLFSLSPHRAPSVPSVTESTFINASALLGNAGLIRDQLFLRFSIILDQDYNPLSVY